MSDDVIARAEQALDGVTPGPWEYDGHSEDGIKVRAGSAIENPGAYSVSDMIYQRDVDDLWDDEDTPCVEYRQIERDARFIADTRTLVPDLVAAVQEACVALAVQWHEHGEVWAREYAAARQAEAERDEARAAIARAVEELESAPLMPPEYVAYQARVIDRTAKYLRRALDGDA